MTWRWRIAISWRRSAGVTRFVSGGSRESTSFAFTTFIEIEGQSNGLHICTRPEVLFTGDRAAS